MVEEYLDVVNERDEVIATATREAVHRQALTHRSAHLLIMHPDNAQVFLQKRASHKEDFPNCWDVSVSGHVSAGETYEQCIARECMEEVGIEVNETLREITKLMPSQDNGHEFIMVYLMFAKGPMSIDTKEITEGKWFDVAQVDALLCSQPTLFAGAFSTIWYKVIHGKN